jgi:Flp pilus assembly protein TadG
MPAFRSFFSNSRGRRRGSSLIEFTLVGIPAIIICTCVLTCAIDMWQLYTLSYAVDQTARYAALHGNTCSMGSNSCTITRTDVATYFQNQAIALVPSSTTMILDDGSGAITCNPVNSCPSSSSRFPAAGSNLPATATTAANTVTVQATYQLINPIFMFWPGTNSVGATRFTVGATSKQPVIF